MSLTTEGPRLVTVTELHALRARRRDLNAACAAVARLGHRVPVELQRELDALSTVVQVAIGCLLCGCAGAYLADIAGDATPHAAICQPCSCLDDAATDEGQAT